MTVTYTAEVATSKGFGCFLKLLFRWRGGIYKLVWPDLLVFLTIFFSLSFVYRFALDDTQKRTFERISGYCESYSNYIPVSFVLGFYVSIVVTRWWNQYTSIPWPDSIAVYVSACIHGQDDRGRLMRRTIMRYTCLCLTIVFTMISPRVKKRFPTLDHLVEAGLLLENEKEIIDDLNKTVPGYSKQWLPIVWSTSIVTRARKEGRIRDDFAVKTIIDALNQFRGDSGTLLSYDWISVPLVYTQVVTLAVYSFFFACLMGRQFVNTPGNPRADMDIVFPLFTTLQFFFYMGWLKVAETLINPFGEDDDDFEISWLVDRNLKVSYLIVDEMHHEHPELIKDQYWDEVLPMELPYTLAAEQYREEPPEPSTARIAVPEEDAQLAPDKDGVFDTPGSPSDSPIKRSLSRLSRLSSRRSRRPSLRSNASRSTLASSTGQLNRATSGSIASIIRRVFTRERSLVEETKGMEQIPSSGNLSARPKVLTDVIPELDENLTTIVSVRGEPPRPTVFQIFGPDDQVGELDSASGGNSPTLSDPHEGHPFRGPDTDSIPSIEKEDLSSRSPSLGSPSQRPKRTFRQFASQIKKGLSAPQQKQKQQEKDSSSLQLLRQGSSRSNKSTKSADSNDGGGRPEDRPGTT